MPLKRLLLTFGLPAALCAAWTVFAGKDVNWDLLNYHFYLPFELLNGRLDQDFFAASAQSYLNPLGYVPFYWMVSAGWHSVVASIALAVVHSASLGLLYVLAYKLFAHLPQHERWVMSSLAAAMGASTAVFWATVGSSFLDPLLVPPMLAGLLLLLEASHPMQRALVAGVLFGAAAALKYSNAIFALAALPLACAIPGLTGAHRVRAGLAYAAGGAAAVALLAGPWLALMLREFGNPVFPLLNAWFQSPHAPPLNAISERFTPGGFSAAVSFPFRMAALDRALYSETFAPDLRLAAFLAAALAVPLAAAKQGATPARALRGSDWRVLVFFVVASLLWLATSANGRYGLLVLLLAGLCLVRFAERLLAGRWARVATAVLLVTQLSAVIVAAPSRWFLAEPWSRHWLPYEAPRRALHEPALYLSVEALPMAVVAPFLHPASSFVNVSGQHSLPADSPRLTTLLERHRGRVRTLGRGPELLDGRPRAERLKTYDTTLLRIGYRVDDGDCYTIAWRPDGDDALSRLANRFAPARPSSEPLSVVSCALRTAKRDPAEIAEERRVSALFDRIEKRCPALVRGQTAVTEPLPLGGWSRHYPQLDARLESRGDRVILNRYRTGTHDDLGRLSDWQRENAALPAGCMALRQIGATQ